MNQTSPLSTIDTEVKADNELLIKSFFFNTVELNNIQEFIQKCVDASGVKYLGASLVTMISELYHHAVRENFKYVFMEHLVKEMGMEYLDTTEKEDLFQAEMDSSRAQNFRNHCEDLDIFTTIRIKLEPEAILFVVEHFGKFKANQAKNIQETIKMIESYSVKKNLHQLVSQSRVMDAYEKGLPMALFTFRGLGIPDHFFKIKNNKNKISFNITVPLEFYQNGHHQIKISEDNSLVKNLVWEIFDELELSTVTFSYYGNILEVSNQLMHILNLDPENASELRTVIPDNFFEDIFISPFSVHNFVVFENYRVTVPIRGKNLHCLFNVSGIKKQNNLIVTLWQAVNIDAQKDKFTRGSLFENMNIMRLISPYIPKMVLEKARVSIKHGLNTLPVESETATIFFADLAGFTQKSETMSHHEIVELLNLTMTNIVTSIDRHNGYVDKFIGDGVMCIFFNPLDAVIAAVEIQNNLMNLNEFRNMTNQPPLELRIGLNTGNVILGSIGTKERMDWTALGDVVNTASRIESNTLVNNVGISSDTYELVKESLETKDQMIMKFKGKEAEQTVYFVSSVSFEKEGKHIKLDLQNPEEY